MWWKIKRADDTKETAVKWSHQMKQPLLILSISLLVVCCKNKDKKITPALSPVTLTYNSDLKLTSTRQIVRGFAEATVFWPDLNDAVSMSASNQNIKFNISGATLPALFTPHVTSAIKSLSTETAINVSGGTVTYDAGIHCYDACSS